MCSTSTSILICLLSLLVAMTTQLGKNVSFSGHWCGVLISRTLLFVWCPNKRCPIKNHFLFECPYIAFFSIYLVDGVTGATIHHTTHRNAAGPVNLELSENWIVVSCHGYHMSHLDFFS